MLREIAKELVERYFKAWLDKNEEMFLSVLHDEIIIKESYGPVYEGKPACLRWFNDWHRHENRVTIWNIDKMYFDDDESVMTVEWYFECVFEGNQAGFLGSSVICFENDLIISVNEYSMKKEQYKPYN